MEPAAARRDSGSPPGSPVDYPDAAWPSASSTRSGLGLCLHHGESGVVVRQLLEVRPGDLAGEHLVVTRDVRLRIVVPCSSSTSSPILYCSGVNAAVSQSIPTSAPTRSASAIEYRGVVVVMSTSFAVSVAPPAPSRIRADHVSCRGRPSRSSGASGRSRSSPGTSRAAPRRSPGTRRASRSRGSRRSCRRCL